MAMTSERITRYLQVRDELKREWNEIMRAEGDVLLRSKVAWESLNEEEQNHVRRLLSRQASAEGSR